MQAKTWQRVSERAEEHIEHPLNHWFTLTLTESQNCQTPGITTGITGQKTHGAKFNILPGRFVEAIKSFWCLTLNSHHTVLPQAYICKSKKKKKRKKRGKKTFHTLAEAEGFPRLSTTLQDCWMNPNPSAHLLHRSTSSPLPDSPSHFPEL